VDQDEQLGAVAEELTRAPVVALDTEFHSERRHRPALMLVQLALPSGKVYMLDPRAVSLRQLGPALSAVPLWLVHGGALDLLLVGRELGAMPQALLDTQIAAAVLGEGYPARLGALLSRWKQPALSKAETLTDWARRPLSPQQLAYAAADVISLYPLARAMLEQMDEFRARITLEAGLELRAGALGPPDVHSWWQRLEVSADFDDATCAALAALSAWREQVAAEQDQPAFQVLSDGLALDLARRRPRSLGELQQNRRFPAALVKQHGAAIIEAIRTSAGTSPPPRSDRAALARLPLIQAWAAAEEGRTGIHSRLLLPPELARALAEQRLEALLGWRRELLLEGIQHLLAGGLALYIEGGRPSISKR
jgi:ribonuclease D